MQGWISLHRKIQCHPFYKERRKFSKFEAWIDLLLEANHSDKEWIAGNEVIIVKRGSFITSEVQLMERWKWSKSKVRAYLILLQSENMIIKKSDSKKTTIYIVNYDNYQRNETAEKPKKDRKKTAKELQKDTTNNGNNDNNEISTSDNCPYEEVKTIYNKTCYMLPQIRTVSNERKKHIKARWNQYNGDIDIFKQLFNLVAASSFLTGKNDRKWTADFDWILNENNMTKILEGKYKNKPDPMKDNFL